jgi:tripartite-type tricarboxylate transporter receptor subunit TctC
MTASADDGLPVAVTPKRGIEGRMFRLLIAFAVFALASFASAAQAQPYPSHPVRIVVGFAAGSGPDVLARSVGNQLGNELGQSFYVENRTGANGTIAAKMVVQAEADGYTLLYSSAAIATTPWVYKNISFDILRDLAPIATVGILDGYFMLVNPSLPVYTVPEFIAYAKANPVRYGSPGVGNQLHLAAELFKVKAGISMQHIPYKGASEVATALLQGSIHVMFVTPTSVFGLVKEGKLRAIATTGTKPFPDFPNVPLLSASVPSYPPSTSWGMFFAPAKTPAAIVDKLSAGVRHALTVPAVADVAGKAGYVPDGRSAAQTAEFFRKEVAEAGEAVRAAGIEPN